MLFGHEKTNKTIYHFRGYLETQLNAQKVDWKVTLIFYFWEGRKGAGSDKENFSLICNALTFQQEEFTHELLI